MSHLAGLASSSRRQSSSETTCAEVCCRLLLCRYGHKVLTGLPVAISTDLTSNLILRVSCLPTKFSRSSTSVRGARALLKALLGVHHSAITTVDRRQLILLDKLLLALCREALVTSLLTKLIRHLRVSLIREHW